MKAYPTTSKVWILLITMAGIVPLSLVANENATPNPLQDRDITRAIEEEMQFDTVVPFNDIDVSTIDGIVSLSGSADNLLAKNRATLIAETVRGVRSVSNQITVEPISLVGPRELESRVNDALLYDPVVESYEVSVKANNSGALTLTGEVDSWQEKQLVAQVAAAVRGVTEVNNSLRISFASDRPDYEIKTEIEKRLNWSTLVDDSLIDVAVVDGKASLSGIVGSSAEKRHVLNLAWVGGVNFVDTSELIAERWARDPDLRESKYQARSDLEIQDALQDALFYDPRVVGLAIESEVDDGWITLTGTVDNIRAKESAESVAHNTVGVLGVSNLLKVRHRSQATDAEIESTVLTKLKNDPWVDFENTQVEAVTGTVRLTGIVDNLFERAHAERLAQSTVGVSEIKNRLKVYDTESIVVYDPYIWNYYPLPWSYYDNGTMRRQTMDVYGSTESDQKTAKDIANELFWSPFVDHDDVNVIVEDGIVTLIGTVESKKEKEAATENAYKGGALLVENDLRIES